eukprot:TRINITY_DN8903_c0_g1_i3.p3 TRINITY_DN8903_c0_g1~~TRINITY_DN8903_c0_g1_i3.p3  ORF type:complete len:107 (+),score=13.55 TRINITY_DN8903_c0_g1_i3:162-482(+)
MPLVEATRVLNVVFKQSGGLVWKNWPMNRTRRANAKKRHCRISQVEAVIKACSNAPPKVEKLHVQKMKGEGQVKEFNYLFSFCRENVQQLSRTITNLNQKSGRANF